jgi:MFS family permease
VSHQPPCAAISHPPAAPRTARRPRAASPTIILSAVCLATFLVSLSTSSLGVAVPAVTRHLHASPLESTLIVITPALVSTTLLLVLGRIGDLVGRRGCYLLGLSIFTVASLFLGFAPTVWLFIGLQTCAAVGVAAVWANSAAILLDALDVGPFHRGLGIYIATISAAELIGPTVGGAITQAIGWEWIFWINAIVGVGCTLWGWRSLPAKPSARARLDIDVAGAVLFILGLGGFIVSLLIAESGTGLNRAVVGGASASLVVLGGFVLVERHASTPLVDVTMFSDRAFSFSMVSGGLMAMAQWVPSLLMVLFFQAVRGDTPLQAGLRVMPLPVSAAVFSVLAGPLGRFLPPRRLAILGAAISAAALGVLTVTITAPYPVTALTLAVIGVGTGIFTPAIADSLMRGAPAENAGQVNGTRLTVQNVGWVSSTALALVLITAPLPASQRHQFFAGTAARVSRDTVAGLIQGYRHSLTALAVIAVIGTCFALWAARAAQPAVTMRGTSDIS